MMKNKITLWFFSLFFLSGFFLFNSAGAQAIQVSIQVDKEYQQTDYTAVASDKNQISLITYQTDINKGVLSFRSESDAPFNEQVHILSILLSEVLKTEKDNKPETLFIGGLVSAFGRHNTLMAQRLALAAYMSDLWDSSRGGPVSGHENDLMIRLSNQHQIYPELSRMFSRFGYSVQVSGMEKVFIDQAGKLPFADALKAKGVKALARLPYDCLTWFSIKKDP